MRFAPTQANGAAVSLLGIDPATYPQVSGLTFSEGDESAYDALADGRTAILSPAAAASLGATIGDEVELMTPTGPQLYRVVGVGGDYLNATTTSPPTSTAPRTCSSRLIWPPTPIGPRPRRD